MFALYQVPEYAESQPTVLATLYRQSPIVEPISETWLLHVMNGTGGNCSVQFYRDRYGYRPFPIIERMLTGDTPQIKPYVRLMTEIKLGFGRTMTRLPKVFGVSRQTLYNWSVGETPKEVHHAKLVELSEAARVFSQAGFTPTAAALDRTVARGMSFLELLADGADGGTTARSLMKIVDRGLASKARLAAALADAPVAPVHPGDIGAPAVDEET